MSKIKNIVHYFFYHTFSDEVVDRVHRRLTDSADTPDKEEAFQEIWSEIGFPEATTQTEQAFTEIENKLRLSSDSKAASIPKRHAFRLPVWIRTAALWLIPLLSIAFSYYMYRENARLKAPTFTEHFVPAGKREHLTLPDGSRVWLNSGSLLIYPSAFTSSNREVYLAGEGYFDVQKKANQTFIVKTRALQVEVVGTKFNLSAYPEAEQITTTLEEGSVKVFLSSDDHVPYYLKPDEQLIYLPETREIRQEKVAAPYYSNWREGGLLFTNTSFKEILRTLERTYNVRIHLQTSAYDSNRLTIRFNENETLENVWMLIKEMIPGINYRIEEQDIYIK